MAEIKISSPETLGRPRGQYSQITRVKAAETLYIAGQVAADANGTIIGDGDFDAQCTQIFANIEAALAACGAGWKDVVQFTTYLVDADDIPKFFAYRLRAPGDVSGRGVSAEYAADRQPAGRRAVQG